MSHFRFEDASRLPYRLPDTFPAELAPYLDASGGIPNHSIVRCYGLLTGVTCTDGRPGQLMAVQTEGVISELVSPTAYFPVYDPETGEMTMVEQPWVSETGQHPPVLAIPICEGLELCIVSTDAGPGDASLRAHVIAVDLKRSTYEIILTNPAILGDYLGRLANARAELEYTSPGNIVLAGPTKYQKYGLLPPSDTDGDGDIDGDDTIEYGPIVDEDGNPVYEEGVGRIDVTATMAFVLGAVNQEDARDRLGIGGGSGGPGVSRLNTDTSVNKPGAGAIPLEFGYKNGWEADYEWDPADPSWIMIKPGATNRRIHFKSNCYSAAAATTFVSMQAQIKDADGNWQLTSTSADVCIPHVGNIISGDTGFLLSGLRYRFMLNSAGALNVDGPLVEIYRG